MDALNAAERALGALPPSATQFEAIARLQDLCDDDFFVYSFKVVPCAKSYSHKWTLCPCAHQGETARRRDPRIVPYKAFLCPLVKAKKACLLGDSCGYAHNVFEHWLHPARYKTRLCSFGRNCTRPICFFAHASEELRSTGSSELHDSQDNDDLLVMQLVMAQDTGLLQVQTLPPDCLQLPTPQVSAPTVAQSPSSESPTAVRRFKAPARTTVAVTRGINGSPDAALSLLDSCVSPNAYSQGNVGMSRLFMGLQQQQQANALAGGGSKDSAALLNALMASEGSLMTGRSSYPGHNHRSEPVARTQSGSLLQAPFTTSQQAFHYQQHHAGLHQLHLSDSGSSYSGGSLQNSGKLHPPSGHSTGLEGLMPLVTSALAANKQQQQQQWVAQQQKQHHEQQLLMYHQELYGNSSGANSGNLPALMQTSSPAFCDQHVPTGVPPSLASAFSSNASASSADFSFADLMRSESNDSYDTSERASSNHALPASASQAGAAQLLAQLQGQGCSKEQLMACLSQMMSALLAPAQ